MNSLNINERVIDPTTVRKSYKAVRIVTKQPAYLAELNLFNPKDMQTVNAIKYIWKDNDIALFTDVFSYESNSTSDVKSRYFVLTEQSDDFNKIKPSAILGIVKTTTQKKGHTEVDFVRVNPFYVYNNPYSDLKNVGKTIMEAVHKKFASDKLTAFVPKNIIPFFKKIGWKISKFTNDSPDILMEFGKTLKTRIKK